MTSKRKQQSDPPPSPAADEDRPEGTEAVPAAEHPSSAAEHPSSAEPGPRPEGGEVPPVRLFLEHGIAQRRDEDSARGEHPVPNDTGLTTQTPTASVDSPWKESQGRGTHPPFTEPGETTKSHGEASLSFEDLAIQAEGVLADRTGHLAQRERRSADGQPSGQERKRAPDESTRRMRLAQLEQDPAEGSAGAPEGRDTVASPTSFAWEEEASSEKARETDIHYGATGSEPVAQGEGERPRGLSQPGTAPLQQAQPTDSTPADAGRTPARRPAFAPHVEDLIPTLDTGWSSDVPSPPPVPARPGRRASHGAAMYRIKPTDVDSLAQFGETALRARGVFIRTQDVRPPGTHAVVCVVHPLSRDEFHLVGQVVDFPVRGSSGIAVEFLQINEHTDAQYRYFVALGIPDEDVGPPPPLEGVGEDLADDTEQRRVASDPTAEEFPREATMAVELSDLEIIEESALEGGVPAVRSAEKTERVHRAQFLPDEVDEPD